MPELTTALAARPPATNATAAKLLRAASELMIERNSIDLSLSELARRSGVNSALVKYHFGNKDGLLLALIARDSRAEIENLEYLLNQPLTATEKLKLHIAGIVNAYYRSPYMNRLLHYLLHQSGNGTADEVSRTFARPLFELQCRLLAEGIAAGEFRKVDPVMFYTSLIGGCDYLFHGRRTMSRAIGVGEITDEVRRNYIAHMTELVCGGILRPPTPAPG
jgi:AcrR family transcriptional regulator